jgi:hypothetical protein
MGGIVFGIGQGNLAPFQIACNSDLVAGIGAKAAGHRENFEQSLAALELVDAGSRDGAQHRYRLAPKFRYIYYHLGIFEEFPHARFDRTFELAGGEPGGVYTSGERQAQIASHIDAHRFVTDFFDVGNKKRDLIVGAEDIA